MRVTILIAVILAMAQPATAQDEDSAPSAGAASDPTAAVSFQDFRFRYLDLGGRFGRPLYPKADITFF